MDLDSNPTISQAHPETMDFLSRAWCSFAVQAFQPEMQDQALVIHESSIKNSIIDNKPPLLKMEKSMKMDDTDKSIPPWKSNDVKSWIWMQQAMHPELNYNSYFQKKWMPWKIGPLKNVSIKKWFKEIKQKRKEEKRLQKAEVHAAISVAGVAAALAAIAAENVNRDETGGTKESAVASAAALVAAQCAKVAEAMGAKRDQLSGVIGSAMSGTNASDILTLTAAATTSLRGAETLKARAGFKNILNGSTPVLPIEDSNDYNFNYEKCRSILSKGAELYIEKSDGRSKLRSVSIILNGEAKVILRTRKATMLKAFSRQKESVVLDLHVELYKDSNGAETDSCYLIVLTTNRGIIKLDMMDDHQRYRTWSMAINQMLTLSTSFPKYELQFYKS
ncbi:VAN3-binding protein-like [Nicotiana tabacum]|uniref:VAN3-binding protein-like n=1 Tax=Nicotiana tabacum TaxID=4097 RepID=A0A1S4CLL2_TOBAC|nr:VAN3-binding protein [Nicotiana tomentosiformis]XP_016501829.1 PREDICTED: VAN3-binding protein-like [Nicotiana tabacum]